MNHSTRQIDCAIFHDEVLVEYVSNKEFGTIDERNEDNCLSTSKSGCDEDDEEVLDCDL